MLSSEWSIAESRNDRGGWKALVLAATAVVIYQSATLLAGFTHASQGAMLDEDGYLYLVRVVALHDGHGWWSNTLDRVNAPYGMVPHWTRPFDIVLLSGAEAGSLFASFKCALVGWALAVPPVLQLVSALLLVWAAAPLLSVAARCLLGLCLVLRISSGYYALAGATDHHGLLIASFVLLFGLSLRLHLWPADARLAIVAGLISGFALWLSVELMLPVTVVIVGTALDWAALGGQRADRNLKHAAAMGVAVAAALLIERPPSEWTVIEFDRLSIVALLPPALAASWWGAVLAVERGREQPLSGRVRWGLLLLVACVAVAVGAAVFTEGFFGSSMYADPETRRFFATIRENRPLFPNDGLSFALFLAVLGPVILAASWLPVLILRARDVKVRSAWIQVAISLGAFSLAALMLMRLSPYVEIVSTLPQALMLTGVLSFLSRVRRLLPRAFLRAGLAGAVLFGPAAVAGIVTSTMPASDEGADGLVAPPSGSSAHLIDLLQRSEGTSGQIILTHPMYGPEIVWRTDHSVVATPEHRNLEGLHDFFRFMVTTEHQEARSIAARRGIDLVILSRDWLRDRKVDMPADSMAARLAASDLPAWLKPVELIGGGEEFLVMSVQL